ncbi:MAG: alkaline phosphatase family protein [Vicinamibacterales bacterium]
MRYPLRTVLQWLGPVLGVGRDDIAVFGSWSTFRWIVDDSPTGVLVNAGFAPYRGGDRDLRQLSARQFDTYTPWTRARADRFTHAFGLAHLRRARPRVLYLAFNDADEAAHAGQYEETLDALHAADAHLAELWTTIAADPDLRQHTTLVLTVDHGRGRTSRDWRDHGPGVDGADETWLGCFGPHVTARGVLTDHEPLEERQVAATLAAVVGQDFLAAFPGAAPPIPQCLGRPSDLDARRGPAPRDR